MGSVEIVANAGKNIDGGLVYWHLIMQDSVHSSRDCNQHKLDTTIRFRAATFVVQFNSEINWEAYCSNGAAFSTVTSLEWSSTGQKRAFGILEGLMKFLAALALLSTECEGETRPKPNATSAHTF